MRRGTVERLEKLDGSKRPKAIVLDTMPDENGEPRESNGFVVLTCEEWERKYCKAEPEGEAMARGQK